MRTHRIFVCVIALGAVLAMSSTASAGPSSDQEIADAVVLSADDLPSGFDEKEPGDAASPELPVCRAIQKAADAANAAPNTETEFSSGSGDDSTSVNNQITILPSAGKAKALFRGYAGRRSVNCFEQTFQAQYEELVPAGTGVAVSFSRFESDLGDAAVGYEGVIQLTTDDGEQVDLYFNFEISRVARGLAAFVFFRGVEPFDSDVADPIAEDIVSRLDEALGA